MDGSVLSVLSYTTVYQQTLTNVAETIVGGIQFLASFVPENVRLDRYCVRNDYETFECLPHI